MQPDDGDFDVAETCGFQFTTFSLCMGELYFVTVYSRDTTGIRHLKKHVFVFIVLNHEMSMRFTDSCFYVFIAASWGRKKSYWHIVGQFIPFHFSTSLYPEIYFNIVFVHIFLIFT